MNGTTAIQWKLGLLASTAMMLLAIFPQLHLWAARGQDWQDAVSFNHGLGDEMAYAAYVNALISGRPRRSDPYTGRDDQIYAPQPESLFSIQFIPAYAIAIPARILGLSAITSFIILTPLAAFASSLALFWLLRSVTANDRLAAVGVMVVLCLGALVAVEGSITALTRTAAHFDYFPFLRRYQPAASYPLFFLLFAFVWRALTSNKQRALISAILAGVTFGLLVYSYFYLWTAAAAWLACLALLWLIARPTDWRGAAKCFGTISMIAAAALLPYCIMLSHRSQTIDNVQALVLTRKPDFLHASELTGALILLILAFGALRGCINWRDPRVLFSASFALIPFIVFNQQIITGRMVQPIHYKGFITNYVVLISIVLTVGLKWRTKKGINWELTKRALLLVAFVMLGIGAFETYIAALRSVKSNLKIADYVPVYKRLAEVTRSNEEHSPRPLVFFTNFAAADILPSVASNPVLWAPHMLVFPGVTAAESRERLYQHLYYAGVEAKDLEKYLKGGSYYGIAVGLFGFERVIDGLSIHQKPITQEEINVEARTYSDYITSFSRERAAHPTLSYVVTPAELGPDFSNLDRWYERDAGERIGKFTLYRVKLRR